MQQHSPRHVSASDAGSGDADLDVAQFARRFALPLLQFAYLLCGQRQTAEDLLQEVLAAMYRRFPATMPLTNPIGYARRALVNANISRARHASASEIVSDSLPDAAAPPGEDPADRDLLWRALARLPLRQRTVLVLRFYADASTGEIARMIGARRGTVRSLASRGLAQLRADPSLQSSEGGSS